MDIFNRQKLVSTSIRRAVLYDVEEPPQACIPLIFAFVRMFQLLLVRYEPVLFKRLREQVWRINEDEYADSFAGEGREDHLKPTGDLGYSGSTFFTTPNSRYLVKSLPRRSEYVFFEDELLPRYATHIDRYPNSLLVRITDYLYTPSPALGAWLQLTPSRHLVMENVLHGASGSDGEDGGDEAENYDLKPTSYFFPERDIAGGRLATEATKSRLVDDFEDKIRITARQATALKGQLATDTRLLADANVVDYSLFLVRFPARDNSDTNTNTRSPDGDGADWRTGVTSTDNRWTYRAVLLDFFWAKHSLQAQAMTVLVQTYSVVGGNGPMSITTTSTEYRERFLQMVEDMIEVPE